MAEEVMTFDEILADPIYKSEFDRRVTKALSTVQAKLDAEVEKNKEHEAGDSEAVDALKREIEDYKSQLAERDYSDALRRAISDKGVTFSSKSAEKAFMADLKTTRFQVKDGALEGFDEYLEKAKSEDPGAFVKPGLFDTQARLDGGAKEQTANATMNSLIRGAIK